MEILYENLLQMDWRYLVMWAIGGILIYLAIKKDMEPTLLLPIGFGTILVNLPNSGAITQIHNGVAEPGALSGKRAAYISASCHASARFILWQACTLYPFGAVSSAFLKVKLVL